MKKLRKASAIADRNLFTPRETRFEEINWLVVFEQPDFKMIGLCTDRDKPVCFGTPVIVDAQAAPFQGLPFVSGFSTPQEYELNGLLHELKAWTATPEFMERMLTEPERSFLARWVPAGIATSFEYSMYMSSPLAFRKCLLLEELILSCRQSIYHGRLVREETVVQRQDRRRRLERSAAHWAKVDEQREQDRQLRAKLKRENREIVFTQEVEQLGLFGSMAA